LTELYATLYIDVYLAVTLGIVVLFAGKRLNDAIGFLRDFSIPEPVSGGLLFTLLFTLLCHHGHRGGIRPGGP
jgi:ESS family glutamate:Na+ symporter